MRIQNVNYSTNNYSVKSSKKQQNPSFGKLIIDKGEGEYIPKEILRAVAKNEELKKLVRIFHEIGKNLKLDYDIPKRCLFFFVQDKKDYFSEGIVTSFRESSIFENNYTIAGKINKLREGFAESAFNKYQREKAELAKMTDLEQEALNIIDAFNKSLDKAETKK